MKSETRAALDAAKAQHGFLNEEQVNALATDPETRLTLVLVRCGSGRFLAPAQDAQHFIDIIERDRIRMESWPRDGQAPDPGISAHRAGADYIRDVSLPADFRIAGDPPRKPASPLRETLRQSTERAIRSFDERHCNGAFDGNTVTSDADPGL